MPNKATGLFACGFMKIHDESPLHIYFFCFRQDPLIIFMAVEVWEYAP